MVYFLGFFFFMKHEQKGKYFTDINKKEKGEKRIKEEKRKYKEKRKEK